MLSRCSSPLGARPIRKNTIISPLLVVTKQVASLRLRGRDYPRAAVCRRQQIRRYLTPECDGAHICLSDFSLARLTVSFSGMSPDISMQTGTSRSSGEHTMAKNPCLPMNPSPIQACRSRLEPRSNRQSLAWMRPRRSTPHARSRRQGLAQPASESTANRRRTRDTCPGTPRDARLAARAADGSAELLEGRAERPAGTRCVLEQQPGRPARLTGKLEGPTTASATRSAAAGV